MRIFIGSSKSNLPDIVINRRKRTRLLIAFNLFGDAKSGVMVLKFLREESTICTTFIPYYSFAIIILTILNQCAIIESFNGIFSRDSSLAISEVQSWHLFGPWNCPTSPIMCSPHFPHPQTICRQRRCLQNSHCVE